MQVIWGSHTVIGKYAMQFIPPALYVARTYTITIHCTVRTLIASPLLLLAARLLDKKTFFPANSDLPLVIAIGLLGISANSMLCITLYCCPRSV